MNESQTIQPARASRSLWVLLLACAGALLVIIFTLASDLRDTRSTQVINSFRSVPQATSRGPEADPYLRHVQGYDYELEPPPAELP